MIKFEYLSNSFIRLFLSNKIWGEVIDLCEAAKDLLKI